jgi:hypothetical protein
VGCEARMPVRVGKQFHQPLAPQALLAYRPAYERIQQRLERQTKLHRRTWSASQTQASTMLGESAIRRSRGIMPAG